MDYFDSSRACKRIEVNLNKQITLQVDFDQID